MGFWCRNNYWFLVLLFSFVLFWIFGDIVFYLCILAFIGVLFLLRGIFRTPFIVLEVIFIALYLLLCLIGLLFILSATFRLFLMIMGIWFISSLYRRKRY